MAVSLYLVTSPTDLPPVAAHLFSVGPWTLNTHTNQLCRGTRCVELEQRISSLLVYFLQRPQQVLLKDDIIKAIWARKVVNEESLAVAVSQLRKILDDNPRAPTYIKTIPGVGYQFIWQAPEAGEPDQCDTRSSVPRFRRPWRYAIIALFILAVAGGGYTLGSYQPEPVTISGDLAYTRAKALLAVNRSHERRQAIPLFRQAITQNPDNADAYLGLAEAKMELLGEHISDHEHYTEVHALLTRALGLNPQLARAHMWMGVLLMRHDHDLRGAEERFKASLAISPNDDLSHFLYEQLLLIEKRFDEAREQIALARANNPLSYPYTYLVWVYLLEKNYDLAARELDRIAATEMEDSFFHTAAQNVYYQMGDEQKVYEHMQWFFDRKDYSPVKKAELEQAFQRGGLRAVYDWLLIHKEQMDVGQYTPPLSWARYAVSLGKKEEAMGYLEQAYEKRQFRVLCAVADPRYDPLRNEPRFQRLLQKITGGKQADVKEAVAK